MMPANALRWVVGFDFDGTLTGLKAHPSLVRLPKAMRRVLAQLARCPQTTLAIISGRSLKNLKAACPVKPAWYAGNHGLEIRGPRANFVHPAARNSRAVIRKAGPAVSRAIKGIPGAWVEDKGLTLSIHWRQTPVHHRRRCQALATQALQPFIKRKQARLTHGKCVLEVRPPINWAKGDALKWIARHLPKGSAGLFPLFVGDDATDEDAFRVVNRLGGASIRMGRPTGKTFARYWLKDSAALLRWLTKVRMSRCSQR